MFSKEELKMLREGVTQNQGADSQISELSREECEVVAGGSLIEDVIDYILEILPVNEN